MFLQVAVQESDMINTILSEMNNINLISIMTVLGKSTGTVKATITVYEYSGTGTPSERSPLRV